MVHYPIRTTRMYFRARQSRYDVSTPNISSDAFSGYLTLPVPDVLMNTRFSLIRSGTYLRRGGNDRSCTARRKRMSGKWSSITQASRLVACVTSKTELRSSIQTRGYPIRSKGDWDGMSHLKANTGWMGLKYTESRVKKFDSDNPANRNLVPPGTAFSFIVPSLPQARCADMLVTQRPNAPAHG